MKKYIARMLRRAAQKLDPQKPVMPWTVTTSGQSGPIYYEVLR